MKTRIHTVDATTPPVRGRLFSVIRIALRLNQGVEHPIILMPYISREK